LARQNFSDAEKYANELRELKFKQDQLNANAAVLNANILKDVAQAEAALRPRVATGRQITPNQMMQIRQAAEAKARPELDAIDDEFKSRSGLWTSMTSAITGKKPIPSDWKTNQKDPDAIRARAEYERLRQEAINRKVADLTGGMLGVRDLSNPSALAAELQ
jgi:hypothetical protein